MIKIFFIDNLIMVGKILGWPSKSHFLIYKHYMLDFVPMIRLWHMHSWIKSHEFFKSEPRGQRWSQRLEIWKGFDARQVLCCWLWNGATWQRCRHPLGTESNWLTAIRHWIITAMWAWKKVLLMRIATDENTSVWYLDFSFARRWGEN